MQDKEIDSSIVDDIKKTVDELFVPFHLGKKKDEISLDAQIYIENEVLRQCKRMKCDDQQIDIICENVTDAAKVAINKALNEYLSANIPFRICP